MHVTYTEGQLHAMEPKELFVIYNDRKANRFLPDNEEVVFADEQIKRPTAYFMIQAILETQFETRKRPFTKQECYDMTDPKLRTAAARLGIDQTAFPTFNALLGEVLAKCGQSLQKGLSEAAPPSTASNPPQVSAAPQGAAATPVALQEQPSKRIRLDGVTATQPISTSQDAPQPAPVFTPSPAPEVASQSGQTPQSYASALLSTPADSTSGVSMQLSFTPATVSSGSISLCPICGRLSHGARSCPNAGSLGRGRSNGTPHKRTARGQRKYNPQASYLAAELPTGYAYITSATLNSWKASSPRPVGRRCCPAPGSYSQPSTR